MEVTSSSATLVTKGCGHLTHMVTLAVFLFVLKVNLQRHAVYKYL